MDAGATTDQWAAYLGGHWQEGGEIPTSIACTARWPGYWGRLALFQPLAAETATCRPTGHSVQDRQDASEAPSMPGPAKRKAPWPNCAGRTHTQAVESTSTAKREEQARAMPKAGRVRVHAGLRMCKRKWPRTRIPLRQGPQTSRLCQREVTLDSALVESFNRVTLSGRPGLQLPHHRQRT